MHPCTLREAVSGMGHVYTLDVARCVASCICSASVHTRIYFLRIHLRQAHSVRTCLAGAQVNFHTALSGESMVTLLYHKVSLTGIEKR